MTNITDQQLNQIEDSLQEISPYPWKCEKIAGGEYWITAPDSSDHEYRSGYEPMFESSGTPKQFGIDGEFMAKSPEVIMSIPIRAS